MINTHETPEKGITRERQNSRFPAFLTISAMWWFHFRSRETFTPRILACETISICLSLIAIGSSSRDSFVLNFSARRWGFLTNPHLHTLCLIQLELAEWDEAIQVTHVIQYITNVTGYSVQKITQHISIPYRSNCIIKGSWKVCCANPQGGRFSAQLLLQFCSNCLIVNTTVANFPHKALPEPFTLHLVRAENFSLSHSLLKNLACILLYKSFV